MPPMVVDSRGQAYRLGRKLGSGAEGTVYEVDGNSAVVAKIYEPAFARKRGEKVVAMTAAPHDGLETFVAWPQDVLYERPGAEVAGFLMRSVAGRQLHDAYGPKSRMQWFPHAGWKFLVAAAANLARAVASVHACGHAVGDLNQRNVLVDGQAVVTILDTDSFEVNYNGKQYHCGVGVESHTPPELQGIPLGSVVRTPNHDAFALAVSIFQLLFLGRHPFDGQSLDGVLSQTDRIRQGKYAYGPNAAARRMSAPIGTVPVTIVPPKMVDMFERAFTTANRPTAADWAEDLGRLHASLVDCAMNPLHQYMPGLATCPWCELAGRTAVIYFLAPIVGTLPYFDLTAVWAAIEAVPAPNALPVPATMPAGPSETALAVRKRLLVARGITAAGSATAVTAVALTAPVTAALIFGFRGASALAQAHAALVLLAACIAAGAGLGLWFIIERWVRAPLLATVARNESAARKLTGSGDPQLRSPGLVAYQTLKAELETHRRECERVPAIRAQRLAALTGTVRQRALEQYLDTQRIMDSAIPGIGPGRGATLLSYGIETALDVTRDAVESVPGFGPALATDLVFWREQLERGFRFDPTRFDDSAARDRIEREEANRLIALRQSLATGKTRLDDMRQRADRDLHARALVRARTETELEQARIDLAALPHPAWIAGMSVLLSLLAAALQAMAY